MCSGHIALLKTFFGLAIISLVVLLIYFDQFYKFQSQLMTIKVAIKGGLRETENDIPKNQTVPPRLIIYWSGVFGHTVEVQTTGVNHTHKWPFFYAGKKGECPVPCELSNDHSRADEASAFVVHARDPHMIPPSNAVPWILQTNENPVYTPALSNAQFISQFKLLVSYRLDSDFPAPIAPMPELTPPVPFEEKHGIIMAAFSHCESVRTEYMRQLMIMKHVTVDSYGICLHNKDGLMVRYGKANGKYVFKERKMLLARSYKFVLVFMNQDCDYFVDDRLYHALSSGSVPVYMGTDKVDEFLPGNLNNSIIKVRDFGSPKDLADYLKYLSNNKTAYNKYLEWKWKGIGDIEGTAIGDWWKPKYPLFCQVCIALTEGKVHQSGLKPITCRARSRKDWGI